MNRRPRRAAFWLAIVTLCAALFAVMARSLRASPVPSSPFGAAPFAIKQLPSHKQQAPPAEPATPTTPSPQRPAGPRPVYVGVYTFRVPQLDLTTNSYLMDFWIWFRWQGNDINPSETFEFLNLYEGWDVLKQATYTDDSGAPKPDALGDDWYYQVFHVQARFGHPFDVRAYPFDHQVIQIEIEDSDLNSQSMVYVPDKGTYKVDRTLMIPGWIIRGVSAYVTETVYPTNFGDTRRPENADSYSRFHYAVQIHRPVLGYIATTILPVAIVMLITFIMFLIDSKYFEGRLGLGITSLISAVALQLTAAGDLPKTGYLVLLDHVYNLSYLVIFLSLVESVVAVRLYDADKTQLARKLDRWALVFMSLLFFGGMTLIILLR